MNRLLFDNQDKSYISYKNAKKAVEKLEGNFKYLISATEDGRYCPIIFVETASDISFHYYIYKGFCTHIR